MRGKMRIDTASIIVPDGRRIVRDIGRLEESIKEVGITEPIVISESRRLVHGMHRLAAAKRLGWATVPVLVMSTDELDHELRRGAELIQIHHKSWSALELAEQVKALRNVYEGRWVYVKPSQMAGKAAVGVSEVAFTNWLAQKLGVARVSVERWQRVARIPDDLRALLRNSPAENNQVTLEAIAEAPWNEQRRLVELARSGARVATKRERIRTPANTARRRKPRTRQEESERVREVFVAVRKASVAWKDMVMDWSDARRLDMAFAVRESPKIQSLFAQLATALGEIADKCAAPDEVRGKGEGEANG